MITILLKRLDGTVTTSLVDPKAKIAPHQHFTADEFLINKKENIDLACASEYDIETLEAIRFLYDTSVTVTSVGRTPKYNARKDVGGESTSCHQYMFDCLDFIVEKATKEQYDNIYAFLKYRGYTGIGRYSGNRFHMDRGYRSKLKEWDMR